MPKVSLPAIPPSVYRFELEADGRVKHVLRDGVVQTSATLVANSALVTDYFQAAKHALGEMTTSSDSKRRYAGIQTFLMTLTAVEAFTNIFFHQLSDELGRPEIRAGTFNRSESPPMRLKHLAEISGLADDTVLPVIDLLKDNFSLRNDLVHPRWEPAELHMPGIQINGLAHDWLQQLEDANFCTNVFDLACLLVLRIGLVRGNRDPGGFAFHWTGQYGLDEALLSDRLQI